MRRVFNFLKSELGRIILGLLFFIAASVTDYLMRASSFSVEAMILYIISLVISGGPVFVDAVRGILRRDLLDEKFLKKTEEFFYKIKRLRPKGRILFAFYFLKTTSPPEIVMYTDTSLRALSGTDR